MNSLNFITVKMSGQLRFGQEIAEEDGAGLFYDRLTINKAAIADLIDHAILNAMKEKRLPELPESGFHADVTFVIKERT